MKTKLVFWGTNEKDERVLIGMQLRAKDNVVDIFVFPESTATEEFSKKLMNNWRNGEEVEFPQDHQHIERELSVSDSILPDNLKVERSDIVQRAQTEWHFVVLSSKLNEAYQSELADIKEKIEKLSSYDSATWESLKTFWSKVQTQVRERNLFREHANSLRDNTNELFARMKELRASLDEEFQNLSKDHFEKFMNNLQDIEKRIVDGMNLNGIFEDLKRMQRTFRDTKFTKEHRSKVWERLDGAFKTVKEKRFGPSSGRDSSPSDRLKRRYDGLINALNKMDRSIERDKDNLAFQTRKVETTDGQLEMQIRQAKIKMIEERIRSKGEKRSEMMQTKGELEKRMEIQKQKDAKKAEREKLEEAKKQAAEKIAQDIKKAEKGREEIDDELKKAASEIKSTKSGKSKAKSKDAKADTIMGAVAATLGESLEDVVDTVKAVAEVVGDRIESAIEEFKQEHDDSSKEEVKSEEE